MTLTYRFLSLYLAINLLFIPIASFADTLFVNGHYANQKTYRNKENKSKILHIPNAEALAITIEGKTEKNYDFLIIYDSDDHQIYHESGDLPHTTLTVVGSNIRVQFKSDGATVATGVKVEIQSISLFNSIKTSLHDVITTMTQQGTGEIYSELKQLTNELKTIELQLVQNNQLLYSSTIVEYTSKIATTYRRVATTGKAIMANHAQQFTVVANLQQQSQTKIQQLQTEKSQRQQSLARERAELENPNLPSVIQKLQISINVEEKAIKTLEKQETAWYDFYQTQLQLMQKMRIYTEKVNFLCYFLNENAQLYELASKTISLNKTEFNSINDSLTDLAQLHTIVNDIEKSETALNTQLLKIEETDFTP